MFRQKQSQSPSPSSPSSWTGNLLSWITGGLLSRPRPRSKVLSSRVLCTEDTTIRKEAEIMIPQSPISSADTNGETVMTTPVRRNVRTEDTNSPATPDSENFRTPTRTPPRTTMNSGGFGEWITKLEKWDQSSPKKRRIAFNRNRKRPAPSSSRNIDTRNAAATEDDAEELSSMNDIAVARGLPTPPSQNSSISADEDGSALVSPDQTFAEGGEYNLVSLEQANDDLAALEQVEAEDLLRPIVNESPIVSRNPSPARQHIVLNRGSLIGNFGAYRRKQDAPRRVSVECVLRRSMETSVQPTEAPSSDSELGSPSTIMREEDNGSDLDSSPNSPATALGVDPFLYSPETTLYPRGKRSGGVASSVFGKRRALGRLNGGRGRGRGGTRGNLRGRGRMIAGSKRQMQCRTSAEGQARSSDRKSGGRGKIYCFCRKSNEIGPMVECDNKQCPLEWVHYKCVGIPSKWNSIPGIPWYCPWCRFEKNIHAVKKAEHELDQIRSAYNEYEHQRLGTMKAGHNLHLYFDYKKWKYFVTTITV